MVKCAGFTAGNTVFLCLHGMRNRTAISLPRRGYRVKDQLIYSLSSPGQGMPGLSGILGKTAGGHGREKASNFSCWSSHPAVLEKEKSSGKEKIHFHKIQMMHTVGCWLKVVHIPYCHTSSTGGHHMNTHYNISISAKPWGVVYSCWNYFFQCIFTDVNCRTVAKS